MKRIAYAEDDPGTRELFVGEFRDALSKYSIDAEIDDVDDGRKLVDLVLKGKYDLVFTDFMMPELSGLKAIVEIRKKNPTVPIYVLCRGDKYTEEDALDAGADGHINNIKADAFDEIESAIVKHLRD